MKKLVIALAALVTLALMPSAGATVGLRSIEGYVRDNLGRPLDGATVTDGRGNSTSTSAAGWYSLPVPDTGDYRITAARSDIDNRAETITVALTDIAKRFDFTVYYLLTSNVSKTAISTATATATFQLTSASGAPSPGFPGEAGKSCLKVLDSRTGTTSDVTLAPNWVQPYYGTKHIDLPMQTKEGNYTLTPRVVECATGTTLSKPVAFAVSYTVDNTPPSIPRDSLVPADGTNSAHGTGQALLATVTDKLSGIVNSSITFYLHDAEGNEVFKSGSTPTTRVTYNSATGQAVTPPTPVLQQGKLYFMSVLARDQAGNEAAAEHSDGLAGGGFLPSSVVPQGTTASIPRPACTLASSYFISGPHMGMKQVTCENVPVHLASTSVSLGGVRHLDSGYVSQTFGLDTAVVSGTMAGAPATWPAYQKDDPAWGPKTRSMRFDLEESSSSATTTIVPSATVTIGRLVTYVPATFEGSVSLQMGQVATTASTGSCANPSTSTAPVKCSPDPLDSRFVVVLKESANKAAAAARHTSTLGVVVRGWDDTAYSAFVPPESLTALATDADVLGVRRETSGSELYPDDWDDAATVPDVQGLTPQVRSLFGARFGGDWLDRGVVPAVWRIGVKNATPSDQAALDGLTGGDLRVKVQAVGHSESDFRSYVETAKSVLLAHGVRPQGISAFHPGQTLRAEVTSITSATESALVAALPAGVPRIVIVAEDTYQPDHLNQTEGLPLEGGQMTLTNTTTGSGNCTVAFATRRVVNGVTEYGGATAGHCARTGDGAFFSNNSEYEKDPTFVASTWFDQTENYGDIPADSAVFAGLDAGTVTNRLFVGPEDAHRTITGKFGNNEIKLHQHTCFQGATSAQPTPQNNFSGTFDNCGFTQRMVENQLVGRVPTNKRTLARSWCFGPVTIQGGDSGGPVYEARDGATVRIKGIISGHRTDTEDGLQRVQVPNGANTQASRVDNPTNREACFSTVADFENASHGWSLHY